MKAVLNSVLSQDPIVRKGTSAYIDDILINEDVVKASRVQEHLEKFGLSSKPCERLADGARVLGLRVWGEQGGLVWKRDSEVDNVPSVLTRRLVFSFCGKLVGHYPVCGWLRVATAFIKRRANFLSERWDDVITDEELKRCLDDVVHEVKKNDPVRGDWSARGDKARVWVDASSLALGAVVEMDGSIIEDFSWLRKDDSSHINMAELDAVIKGLNLALAWKVRTVELMTDSSTVHRWICDGLSGKRRLKTKAASEMLIRRRMGIILSLVEECGLQLSVTLVPSVNNKADSLTRVPQRWLKVSDACPAATQPVCAAVTDVPHDKIEEIHHVVGHPGVKRTLYFVRRVNPAVTRRQVQTVVANCNACQSIDPAPVKWRRGSLEVERVWQRVGMDITHCGGRPYLTLIDCGPSRFAVWRQLRLQTSDSIIKQLEAIFYERGAPEELLTDNGTAFRSKRFADFAKRWDVRLRFRCAHVPSGNGIVERNHRTIKVIAARRGCSVAEAVYLYNLRPNDDHESSTAPANMTYQYPVRVRGVDQCEESKLEADCLYQPGDEVWVRPPNVRCDEQHTRGRVTKILSPQAVEVDGVPRHVRDLHHYTPQTPEEEDGTTESEDDELLIQLPDQNVEEEENGTAAAAGDGLDQALPRRSSRIRRHRVCTVCE